MSIDAFASPKRRLARAKHHIQDFEAKWQQFTAENPYICVAEPHSDGVSLAHKMKLGKPIPDELTDIAYEAVESLRSALDQTAYVIANACRIAKPDRVHFPVTDVPAEFGNVCAGNLKGFPSDIAAVFCSFNAYPGGNDLLVALNRVRRQGFHRLLSPVGSASVGGIGKGGRLVGGSDPRYPTYMPSLVWDREKDEMVFAVVGPGGTFEYELEFFFNITFGNVEGVAYKPIIIALKAMASEVGRVITAVETEAKRLGLVA